MTKSKVWPNKLTFNSSQIPPGDIYSGTTALYRKITSPSSPLAGYNFSFTAKEDKTTNEVDLTLDFFKTQQ